VEVAEATARQFLILALIAAAKEELEHEEPLI
jgi:hypothetical protein